MYMLLINLTLLLLGFFLCFLGAKLIQNSSQNALVFHAYDFTDTHSKGFISSKILGLLLGVGSFESGLFSFMNNKISLSQTFTFYQRESLINWTIVGQYLFVLLLFCPIYIYICFILFYSLGIIWIDKKIYPHTLSIIISLSLIKFSTVLLLMGLTFIKEQDDLNLFGNVAHFLENRYILFTLGTLLGLILHPLAFILIVANLFFYIFDATIYSVLFFLSAVHLGIGIGYGVVTRRLGGQAAGFIAIYSLTHFIVSLVFFLAALSIDQGKTVHTPLQTPLVGILISAVAIIISSLIEQIPSLQVFWPLSKTGSRYYMPYAFNTNLYGGKLFGRELAQMISPVMNYSLVGKEESSDIHQQFNTRFGELQSYANTMLCQQNNTLADHLVNVLTSLLQQLKLLRSNMIRKIALAKHLPRPLMDYIELNKQLKHDALMTTYISLLQNPQMGSISTLEEITKVLCQRINHHRQSIAKWSKNNLKDVSYEEEDAVLEYLLLYESDIHILKKISLLWAQWTEFIPNYYHPHLEYQ